MPTALGVMRVMSMSLLRFAQDGGKESMSPEIGLVTLGFVAVVFVVLVAMGIGRLHLATATNIVAGAGILALLSIALLLGLAMLGGGG